MRARPEGRTVAWLLAALVASSTLIGARAPAPTRFTVAVVRRDGVLLPIAGFDDGRWSSKWPNRVAEVPIGLGDVPRDWLLEKEVPVEWTAWLLSGARQKIKVDAPVVVNVQCARRVALRSSYLTSQAPPPPSFQPYPKDGLAVAGDVELEPVELIAAGSPEAAAFAQAIATSVDAAETKRVKDWRRQWEHPADEATRARTPLAMELLARTAGVEPGSRVYYFEGVKKYLGFIMPVKQPPFESLRRDRPIAELCDYITFAGGWLHANAKGEALKASVGAELTNCNREGVSYTLPLGAFRAGGRLFWIVQTSAWESESYQVIEIRGDDTKTVLSVMGGTCR